MTSPLDNTQGIIINVEPKSDTLSHYMWIINPFLIEHSCHYVSPDFEFGTENKNIWSFDLDLMPIAFVCEREDRKGLETVTLCSLSAIAKKYCESPETQLQIDFCATGVRTNNDKFIRETVTLNSCSEGQKHKLFTVGLSDSEKHNHLQDFNVSDVLVIDFIISKIDPIKVENPVNILDDFRRLFESKNLSDVAIVVEKEVIPVHKAVLAARSPVFSAMLEIDMREKQTNQIEIPDFTHEVILKLLEYMYTDKVEDLESCARSLIGASEQYQLEGLKTMCSTELKKSLSMDNAIETLILADLYRANHLKSDTLSFIANHKKSIENMPNLESLEQSYPHLLREILIASTKC